MLNVMRVDNLGSTWHGQSEETRCDHTIGRSRQVLGWRWYTIARRATDRGLPHADVAGVDRSGARLRRRPACVVPFPRRGQRRTGPRDWTSTTRSATNSTRRASAMAPAAGGRGGGTGGLRLTTDDAVRDANSGPIRIARGRLAPSAVRSGRAPACGSRSRLQVVGLPRRNRVFANAKRRTRARQVLAVGKIAASVVPCSAPGSVSDDG